MEAKQNTSSQKQPPLKLRGTAGALPFWFGTSMYNNNWKGYQNNDHASDWWWFDKDHWMREFTRFESVGLNTMVFWHPHPFVGFVHNPGFPEAQYLTDDEIDRQIAMFRWITAEGKRHGVSIYFLTWNICLPIGMQKAHNLDEYGVDSQLTRRYTRQAVARMYSTYPDLGGLITMAAETPPGCTDFVQNAVAAGLRDSVKSGERRALPDFVFWTWCTNPEPAKKLLDSYPGPKMALHYLQYENFFRAEADPRIKMTSDSLGGVKVVTMGGPVGIPFFGDPFWIRTMMQDLVKKNGGGIFFQGTDYLAGFAERWVAREAFERYSKDPYLPDNKGYWQARIAARYGCEAIAKPLLQAMVDSSNIMPRFEHLVHSQTDHYMPQMGMLLVNILEMPSISTYVFENHSYVDSKGRLAPNMGLTWPNPSWGEEVLTIKQYMAGKRDVKGKKATTPVQIADQMSSLCQSSLAAVAAVKPLAASCSLRAQELKNSLVLMEYNCLMGLHYMERVRCGLAWEAWRLGKASANESDILKHLDASNSYWKKMSELAESVFHGPAGGFQSRVSVEPPWNHMELWQGYTNVLMKPSDMLPIFQRERELIADVLKRPRQQARLPLFPEVDLPSGNMELVAQFDFEKAWPKQLQMHPTKDVTVKLTSDANRRVTQRQSVYCDTSRSSQEWNTVLSSISQYLPLKQGETYVVDFQYRVISNGQQDMPFAIAARTDIGGWQKDVGTYRQWRGIPGQVGHKTVVINPVDYADYRLFISIHGKAAIVIDNLQIRRVRN